MVLVGNDVRCGNDDRPICLNIHFNILTKKPERSSNPWLKYWHEYHMLYEICFHIMNT